LREANLGNPRREREDAAREDRCLRRDIHRKCRPLWTGIAGEPSDSITQSADGSMMFGSADGLVAFGLPQGQG
jgi:hypothetical protein